MLMTLLSVRSYIEHHLGYLPVCPVQILPVFFGQIIDLVRAELYPGCSLIVIPFENSFLLFWPSEFLSLSLFGIGYKITHFGSGGELLLNCIASKL